MVPLSQVANLSLIDSRTISVQPWEKGMGAKIEKAISESELGLNPASMGDIIRVPIPLTGVAPMVLSNNTAPPFTCNRLCGPDIPTPTFPVLAL